MQYFFALKKTQNLVQLDSYEAAEQKQ